MSSHPRVPGPPDGQEKRAALSKLYSGLRRYIHAFSSVASLERLPRLHHTRPWSFRDAHGNYCEAMSLPLQRIYRGEKKDKLIRCELAWKRDRLPFTHIQPSDLISKPRPQFLCRKPLPACVTSGDASHPPRFPNPQPQIVVRQVFGVSELFWRLLHVQVVFWASQEEGAAAWVILLIQRLGWVPGEMRKRCGWNRRLCWSE